MDPQTLEALKYLQSQIDEVNSTLVGLAEGILKLTKDFKNLEESATDLDSFAAVETDEEKWSEVETMDETGAWKKGGWVEWITFKVDVLTAAVQKLAKKGDSND